MDKAQNPCCNFNMKYLILSTFISLFFSQNLYAKFPKVGDEAEYKTTMVYPNGEVEVRKLIQRVASFNDVTKTYIIELNDGFVQSFEIPKDTFEYHYENKDVLNRCKEIVSGTIESITVPAGTLKACAYTIGDQKGWAGLVPFNKVKSILVFPDGAVLTEILTRTKENP